MAGELSTGIYERGIIDELQYKKDIKALQKDLDPTLLAQLETYEKVFLIMGKNYQEVLAPYLPNLNYFIVESEIGLGGYKHLLNSLVAQAPDRLVHTLEKHSKSKNKKK